MKSGLCSLVGRNMDDCQKEILKEKWMSEEEERGGGKEEREWEVKRVREE